MLLRRSTFLLALLLILTSAALSQTPAEKPEVIRLQNVMVKARDGIGLATDIYLPAKNGQPLP